MRRLCAVKVTWLAALATGCLSLAAMAADTVVMMNNDRITGEIVSLEGGKLKVKTDYAGDIVVNWSAVKDISTEGAVRIGLKEGEEVSAAIRALAEQALLLRLENGVGERVELDRIEGINLPPPAPPPAKKPVPWTGGIDVGLDAASGNSEELSFYLGAAASKKIDGRSWLWKAKVDVAESGDRDISRKAKSGLTHKSRMQPWLYQSMFVELEWDELKELDLRTNAGIGLDWRPLRRKSTNVGFEAGVAYTRSDYKTRLDEEYSLRLGARMHKDLLFRSTFDVSVVAYPQWEDPGNYRLNAEATYTQPLTKKLSLKLIADDDYVSHPPEGVLKNDVRLRMALGYKF